MKRKATPSSTQARAREDEGEWSEVKMKLFEVVTDKLGLGGWTLYKAFFRSMLIAEIDKEEHDVWLLNNLGLENIYYHNQFVAEKLQIIADTPEINNIETPFIKKSSKIDKNNSPNESVTTNETISVGGDLDTKTTLTSSSSSSSRNLR